MHQRALAAPVLVSLALISCGGFPTDPLKKDREQATSWESTGELLDREIGTGALPKAYATAMRQLVSQELDRARAKLGRDSAAGR